MGCLRFLCPPRLGDAELIVDQPGSAQAGRRIAFRFLLRSYRLTRQNVYVEAPIPGLPGAPLQFVSGKPQVVSLAMVFDARADDRDVRELTAEVVRLMAIDPATHAPPRLRFDWKGRSLPCVLESASEEILSCFADGRPSRAKLHATFREARTVTELQQGGD